MNQYCRYCVHLCAGNGMWCSAKEEELAESTAKSVNRCKRFEFCEIDAFGETDGYRPRNSGRKLHTADEISEKQISIIMDGGVGNG